MEIDTHSKFLLEEKLQAHEARQGGTRVEIDQKVDIVHRGLPAGQRAEHPQIRHSHGAKIAFSLANGLDDGLSVLHGCRNLE